MNASTPPAAADSRSTDWIVIAKGIGIILVVAGHFHPEDSPVYWSAGRRIIYSFHMPLFFVLSGYLYIFGKYSYAELIKNKTRRLLYPFAAIALGYLVIKLAAAHFVRLDEPVNLQTALAVIIDPVNSYAPLLWFLQTLFLIFCVYPLLRSRVRDEWILILCLALNEIAGSKYPLFGRVIANLPFFAFGVVLRERARLRLALTGKDRLHVVIALGVFALGCIVQMTETHAMAKDAVLEFALAIAGALFVINVSHAVADRAGGMRAVLMRLGYYSMTIYFFHSLFEGAVRIGFRQLERGMAVPFILVALTAILVGLLVPIFLEREFIRKSPLARRFILGAD